MLLEEEQSQQKVVDLVVLHGTTKDSEIRK